MSFLSDASIPRRPSLARWSARWFWGGVATLALLGLGLFIANVIHGLPYWLALRRAQQLDTPRLRAIADACTRHEKDGHQRLIGDAIPPEFRDLKPVRISFYPGSTDITLFERTISYDEGRGRSFDFSLYVFLRVSTNPGNQVIECVSFGGRRQESPTLWERNPEFTRRLNPVDRILTVSQGDMHSQREWIVREKEVLVIDRPYTAGQADQLAQRISLAAGQLAGIKAATALVDSRLRGKAFDLGAADGVDLRICFTPDGRQADDILLVNAWRDEVQPLVQTINELAGKDASITFPKIVQEENALFAQRSPAGLPVQVETLSDYDRRRNWTPLPWWCLWPRFVQVPSQ